MMPVAISTEVVRMPKGSNHHFLNCPPICPPTGRVALALLSLCKTVRVAQYAGRCSRSASRVTPPFLVAGGYSKLKAGSPSFRASGQSSSTSYREGVRERVNRLYRPFRTPPEQTPKLFSTPARSYLRRKT